MNPAEGVGDGPVGVVGESAVTESEVPAEVTTVGGSIDAVLERSPSMVVCVGASALAALARRAPVPPVLAVEAGVGVPGVSRDGLSDALERILDGRVVVADLPVLAVTVDRAVDSRETSHTTRALFDVTLITDEPARISEYSIEARGERRAQFRADGVVVATPQGSHGYSSAASGPVVDAALDAVSVVPVAPFVTRTRRWVLPDDDLVCRVERDEGPVVVQADDRLVASIDTDSTVTIARTGGLSLYDPGWRDE